MWQTILQGTAFSLLLLKVTALSKSTSLDEPFQDSFKNLVHSPCVTLYYRDGRIGCGTNEHDPQSGPLFYFNHDQDETPELPEGEFVAVVDDSGLTANTISALFEANTYNNLKGILILNGTQSDNANDYVSPEYMYPLGDGTPSEALSYGENAYPWNGNGDGLLAYDFFGVPVAYVHGYETSYYIRKTAKNEDKASTITAEFDYYMGPDGVNASDCLSWIDEADGKWNPKCLPLGGTSVWAFAGSPPVSNGNGRRLEDADEEPEEEEEDEDNLQLVGGGDGRPAIVIGASMDSTSLFHDLAPGANDAASNILAVLMAAKLLGESVSDSTLDSLPNRIVFGLFEGEAFGYIGSRNFLRDVMGFECNKVVRSRSKDKNSDLACLYPMRHSVKFMDIGEIAGMLTVDQVGLPLSEGVLYTHNDDNGDIGNFFGNVLKASSTSYYSVAYSVAGENADGDEYPYPPSPLTSLQSLTGGAVGGAVLTGYDYVFAKRPPYHSHLNSIQNKDMDLKAIASAATLLARAAFAAAYDDGSYDYETAAGYAAKVIADEVSYKDEELVDLAECLFVDGNCKMLRKYAKMESWDEQYRTGFNLGYGASLGTPPSYYVGVYNSYFGQPFAQVGESIYGAYDGDDYGKKNSDAVAIQPRMLEQAIRNLLNDYLGRGSSSNNDDDDNNNSNGSGLKSCKRAADCINIDYCAADQDSATCSGSNECVCVRSYYHPALDEAIVPALNKVTGFFEVSEDDEGYSPMYVEPFWSNDVGINLYRNVGSTPGFISLGFGVISAVICFFVTVIVKVAMKKQKIY